MVRGSCFIRCAMSGATCSVAGGAARANVMSNRSKIPGRAFFMIPPRWCEFRILTWRGTQRQGDKETRRKHREKIIPLCDISMSPCLCVPLGHLHVRFGVAIGGEINWAAVDFQMGRIAHLVLDEVFSVFDRRCNERLRAAFHAQ